MRDVLGTIAADQDAIVRAGSKGALVVDGGPGTGKTVVALHRTAYLLYSDPRLGHRRGGVLFVGPHQPYLAYVSDVLPSLGEEGVQTCTLRDLVSGGWRGARGGRPAGGPAQGGRTAGGRHRARGSPLRGATDPGDGGQHPVGRRLGRHRRLGRRLRRPRARGRPQREPRRGLGGAARHPRRQAARRGRRDGSADAGWAATDDGPGDDFDAYGLTTTDPLAKFRRALAADRELVQAFARAWPLIEPTDLVGDLWTVPAYLRRCAPWLDRDELFALQREDATAWTTADLPLLDAARRRLGDPEAPARRARREAADAAERERMADVVTHLIASDDSEMHVMSMLRGQDLRTALVDEDAVPGTDADLLAGPFAHVVVDEAQELTDAEWQMVLARCPSRSLTIVGDRAQARHGFAESWRERLERAGLRQVEVASLNVNYRTPRAVMAEAEPVIRAAVPDANVPTSVRDNGVPVGLGAASELATVVDGWLATHAEGVACVIGDPTFAAGPRVSSLTPQLAKGLEFDLVVLVDPHRFGDGIEGAVDRYVAMTRATQQLVILTSGSHDNDVLRSS